MPAPAKYVRKVTVTKTCAGCLKEFVPGRGGPTFYCVSCKSQTITRRSSIQSMVKTAIRRGQLAPLNPDTKCVDCGEPAKGYEHRDWQKPLEVVPICTSCNW